MNGFQRCFILHARPYRETSLILEVFSEDHGRICLMAKGARSQRSVLRGILQPFTPLLLKWSGHGNMRTLRHAEAISLSLPLSGVSLYSGFYLNEILMRVLESNSPYPQLFIEYLTALTGLVRNSNPEPTLRCFEFYLLESIGYGVDFLHCAKTNAAVDESATYIFYPQSGFVMSCTKSAHLSFQGRDLLAFARRELTSEETLKAAKRFTRFALKPYLGTQPLKSRELFIHLRNGK